MYRALLFAGLAAAASAFAPASGVLPKTATARAAVSRGPSMQDRFAYKTSCGYDIQAPYWAENGGIFGWPDVIWAREAEVKHGRIAMLAALGFPLAETFHPLFGGDINVPSVIAFQQTPLQTFWPVVVGVIAAIEIFSIIPAFENPNIEGWSIKSDHLAGDYGFDPLGLKPTNPAELEEMLTKELNNGRLAMIAIAGMVAQELVTGQKLF